MTNATERSQQETEKLVAKMDDLYHEINAYSHEATRFQSYRDRLNALDGIKRQLGLLK